MSYDVIEFTEESCVFSRSNPSILCFIYNEKKGMKYNTTIKVIILEKMKIRYFITKPRLDAFS